MEKEKIGTKGGVTTIKTIECIMGPPWKRTSRSPQVVCSMLWGFACFSSTLTIQLERKGAQMVPAVDVRLTKWGFPEGEASLD